MMALTPWGELPISDAHVHFFSHRFYAALALQKNFQSIDEIGARLKWEMPAREPVALAARWVSELDRHSVRRACLIASIPREEDCVAQAVALYPSRFYGYFMLDPLQSGSLERLQAASLNPYLHCVCLFPAMHSFSMADERLIPILETAAQGGLPVFVHCGALSVGVRKKLGLPCLFDMRFSNPLDLHAAALRFPNIRFIIPHFGAGLFRETLMLADLCPNVYLDTSSTNRWTLYEGLELSEVFHRAITLLGSSRLLFGTDSSFFPRGWHSAVMQMQLAALEKCAVSAAQAAQILGGNLESLYAERSATASVH